MAPPAAKLSVVAQFDDFCRHYMREEGIEKDFLGFVQSQNDCRKKWHEAELKLLVISKENEELKATIGNLERQVNHVRVLLEKEYERRMKAEEDKDCKQRQIDLIREFITSDPEMKDETIEKLMSLQGHQASHANRDTPNRLDTINESVGSILSPSDGSFEKTEESHVSHRRSRGKRSSGKKSVDISPKRKRSQGNAESSGIVATTTLSVNGPNDITATSRIETQGNFRTRRSLSDPAPSAPTPPPFVTRPVSKSENLDEDPPNFKALGKSSTPSKTGSRGKLVRDHVFWTKTVIKSETCGPCGGRIKFYKPALKCTYCRATCHPECKEKVPVPCVPTSHTPTRKGVVGTIADYAPLTSPMVPALIIYCLQEIESRGLSEVGIYRVSGAEKEVKDLKEKFLRGKNIPNLSKADIHAVCGTVKDFLRSLREPLVTRSMWREFVQASEDTDSQDSVSAIWQCVNLLPQPNRDTLAYLIAHLQRVADSTECKMPISNLARVFGPTIVGFSTADPPSANLLNETEKQGQVMEKLLKVPSDYWNKFIDSVGSENVFVARTPETIRTPEGTILGPLPGRGSWSKKNRGISKAPLSARNTRANKTQYFASPQLK